MANKIDFYSQEYKDILLQRAKDDFEIYNRRRDFRLNEAERRADEEKQRADEEKQRADEEKQRADEEKKRADEEKQRADEEKQRADEEKQRADEEKQRADEAMKKLRNMKEDQLNHIHLIVSRYSLSLDDALDICRIPLDEREEVKQRLSNQEVKQKFH